MENRHKEKYEKHPAYGMASISTINISKELVLFGSKIKHNTFIELKIERAEKKKSIYYDHYFGKKPLIKVHLSPSQFAGLLTQSNTPGVPCTIDFIQGEGAIERLSDNVSVRDDFVNDITNQFKDLEKRVLELKNEIDDDLKGPVKKATKEKIKSNVMKIHQDLESNLSFLMKCQIKKLEDVGVQIISEAEATVNNMIRATGLEHLKKGISQTSQISQRGK
jgi:hypothetical protein